MMKIIDVAQGSKEWLQHRATTFNASDLPAARGVSKYKTRTKLLDELKTGIYEEVDAATKKRFDDGHLFEALARQLTEKIIVAELYPITAVIDVGLSRRLGASFDGLTEDFKVGFEHKTLNAELRAVFDGGGSLPEMYTLQMDQQCVVSGCQKVMFMASIWEEYDGITDYFVHTNSGLKYYRLIEERHCWYTPAIGFERGVVASWGQIDHDLSEHKRIEIVDKPKADVIVDLPTLFVHAKGEITNHNMEAFGAALTARLADVRAIVLITDQDFSNAKDAAKKFRETAKAIAVSKEQMLAQTETIGEAARKMDAWAKDLNATALQLEKDVDREDKAKKDSMVNAASLAFMAYVDELEVETKFIKPSITRPNFAEAIKGKRNYASMQDAIDTMLANSKIDADAVANDAISKLSWYGEESDGYGFLFSDLGQLILNTVDSFKLIVTARISKYKIDEEARARSERQRIQDEEEAKARDKVIEEKKHQLKEDSTIRITDTVIGVHPRIVYSAVTVESIATESEHHLCCASRLRTFEGSDALGEGDFSLLYEAADKIELLVDVCKAQRRWIDSVPKDIALPVMPGFDRDWSDEVINGA